MNTYRFISSCLLLILLFTACETPGKKREIKITKPFEASSVPSIIFLSRSDTVYFNERRSELRNEKDTSLVLGNCITAIGKDTIYYIAFENHIRGFSYLELKAFDTKNNLIGKLCLADTAFIFQSPKKRTSRAYRNSNWIYIESGVYSKKKKFQIGKTEKIEINHFLSPKYDAVYE